MCGTLSIFHTAHKIPRAVGHVAPKERNAGQAQESFVLPRHWTDANAHHHNRCAALLPFGDHNAILQKVNLAWLLEKDFWGPTLRWRSKSNLACWVCVTSSGSFTNSGTKPTHETSDSHFEVPRQTSWENQRWAAQYEGCRHLGSPPFPCGCASATRGRFGRLCAQVFDSRGGLGRLDTNLGRRWPHTDESSSAHVI